MVCCLSYYHIALLNTYRQCVVHPIIKLPLNTYQPCAIYNIILNATEIGHTFIVRYLSYDPNDI